MQPYDFRIFPIMLSSRGAQNLFGTQIPEVATGGLEPWCSTQGFPAASSEAAKRSSWRGCKTKPSDEASRRTRPTNKYVYFYAHLFVGRCSSGGSSGAFFLFVGGFVGSLVGGVRRRVRRSVRRRVCRRVRRVHRRTYNFRLPRDRTKEKAAATSLVCKFVTSLA